MMIFKIVFIMTFIFSFIGIIPKNLPILHITHNSFILLLYIFVLYISNPFREKMYVPEKHDMVFLFSLGIISLISFDYNKYISYFIDLYNRWRNKKNTDNENGDQSGLRRLSLELLKIVGVGIVLGIIITVVFMKFL